MVLNHNAQKILENTQSRVGISAANYRSTIWVIILKNEN